MSGSGPGCQDALQDLRYAFRGFVTRPGFTVAATLTLAVGVGANTAIFTFADGMLFRPLPYRDPDRLVTIIATGEGTRSFLPQIDFNAARDRHRGFDGVVDFAGPGMGILVGTDEPAVVLMYALSEGYLEMLGVQPVIGRGFVPADHQPGRESVALVRYDFWRNQLGADPSVIGRRLGFDELFLPRARELHSQPLEVIGVLPPSFVLPDIVNRPTELFVPRVENPDDDLNPQAVRAPIARLKPGVTLQQAEAEVQTLVAGLTEAYPEIMPNRSARLVPLRSYLFRRVRPVLLILVGSAGLVLLIACANLAGLLLARGIGRRRELAVRAAAGATRWRLAKQSLIESIAIALPGGLVGLIGGYWLFAAMSTRIPLSLSGNVFRLLPAGLDLRVFTVAFGAAVVSAIVFGLLPATRLSKLGLDTVLREATRTSTRPRRAVGSINLLIVGEVALALVLCAGAGLLAISFVKMVAVDLGYRTDGVASVYVNLSRSRYADTPSRLVAYRDIYERLQAVGDVTAVGGVSGSPVITTGDYLYADGQPAKGRSFLVMPGYFRALGIPFLTGRDLTSSEAFGNGQVAVVDERAAAQLWPGEDPVGQSYVDGDGRAFEVIGLTADTERSFTREGEPTVYLPLSSSTRGASAGFVVHSELDLDRLRPALETAVRQFDPDLPVTIGPMTDLFENELGVPRFRALFLGVFAVLAIVLAAVGIYGVVAYAVAGRTREIAVRMALGASARQVRRLVVRESSLSVGAGLMVGGVGAFWATQVLASMLREISPRDPMTFAAASVLLAAIGVTAAYMPARRASRVDPMVALRTE